MADLDTNDFNLINDLKLTDRITLTDSETGHQFASMEVATFLEELTKKMSIATSQNNGLMNKNDKAKIDSTSPCVLYIGERELGVLIKTSIPDNIDGMFYLEISGNSYNAIYPYCIKVQGYNYYTGGGIIGVGGTSLILDIPIEVFVMDGYISFWLKAKSSFSSFIAYCYMINIGDPTFNKIVEMKNIAMPTTINKLRTIHPQIIS